jgi:23S rRNA (adenine-N6)-dimethyltransferase
MNQSYHHPFHERYSQNEIINKSLMQKLVEQSGIERGDLVYDIGAGNGNITVALLNKGARVVAIEKDERLYLKLEKRFSAEKNVKICHADFLDMELPSDTAYKVFANIPFFHTAEIIKKLLFDKAPPADCYLAVQKESAEKYAGIPDDTLVSLLIKPRFWVDILYHFRQTDFFPPPSVDIVLMQFERRKFPLVPEPYYELYRDFVLSCRERTDRTVKRVMKEYFTFSQIKRIFRLLRIGYHSRPAELDFRQYLGLFQFYLGECSRSSNRNKKRVSNK